MRFAFVLVALAVLSTTADACWHRGVVRERVRSVVRTTGPVVPAAPPKKVEPKKVGLTTGCESGSCATVRRGLFR